MCIRDRALEAAGLPQPGKSSCFFCPSMKREEIMLLKEQHPDLYARAIAKMCIRDRNTEFCSLARERIGGDTH